jgi:hypothetical protein
MSTTNTQLDINIEQIIENIENFSEVGILQNILNIIDNKLLHINIKFKLLDDRIEYFNLPYSIPTNIDISDNTELIELITLMPSLDIGMLNDIYNKSIEEKNQLYEYRIIIALKIQRLNSILYNNPNYYYGISHNYSSMQDTRQNTIIIETKGFFDTSF